MKFNETFKSIPPEDTIVYKGIQYLQRLRRKSLGLIELKCPECLIDFKITRSSYNTKIKTGQKNFFCSKKCSSNYKKD